MNRSSYLLWLLIGIVSCDGRRDIRLLEPNRSNGAGAASVLDGNGTSFGGTGVALVADAKGGAGGASGAGATDSAVALPNPVIISRNLMIIKTAAQVAGRSWQLDEIDVANLTTAFTVTFPALVSEFSAGGVVFDNEVKVSAEAITSVGYLDDMIEPENVPRWEGLVGSSGNYDCVFLLSARTQNSIYTLGYLTTNPVIGWISDGPRKDLSKYGDAMGSWLFGWLAAAKIFYSERLGLDHVPEVGDPEGFGYAWNDDGMDYSLAWYRDYLNRAIPRDAVLWGLGDPAWSLGSLRSWAAQQ